MTGETCLGKLIVARTGTGDLQGVGRCVAYCDVPMVVIRLMDGQQFHWRADMCKIVEMDQDVLDSAFPLTGTSLT